MYIYMNDDLKVPKVKFVLHSYPPLIGNNL